MGNHFSNTIDAKTKTKNFYQVIDYIATHYILTMDFKSLRKLSEKEYCNKLVLLTSDIINRYFNEYEVTYLEDRVKNGVQTSELNSDNVTFFNKDNLERLDLTSDNNKKLHKQNVCKGIAKFYIKIAHIFSAIVMTINPVFSYKDEYGNTIRAGLMEKDTIPKGVRKRLYKLNICDNRIRALKRSADSIDNPDEVKMHPKICNMNKDKNGNIKNLNDEPGMTELMALYLDDEYDYSMGTFKGMSERTKKEFMKDLRLFYTTFTGNDKMPDYIKQFSDIKLRDYDSKPACKSILKNKYNINKRDKLFVDYAENIKNMIKEASNNQYKLLAVINELFTYIIDPYDGQKKIRINPQLTEDSLKKIVEKTRKLIVNLYLKCEEDYVKGVKLYEAIVEQKILETTQSQIENLESKADSMITETKQTLERNSQENKKFIKDAILNETNNLDSQK